MVEIPDRRDDRKGIRAPISRRSAGPNDDINHISRENLVSPLGRPGAASTTLIWLGPVPADRAPLCQRCMQFLAGLPLAASFNLIQTNENPLKKVHEEKSDAKRPCSRVFRTWIEAAPVFACFLTTYGTACAGRYHVTPLPSAPSGASSGATILPGNESVALRTYRCDLLRACIRHRL